MAQSIFDSSALFPAMATSLASVDPANVSVQELGLLSDGSSLLAPRHNGSKIILDLTPGDDDWMEVISANSEAFHHLEGEATQALHLVVSLNEADAAKLDAIETKVQKGMSYSVIKSGKTWLKMHRGGGQVVLNLVMSDSVAPTQLLFLQGGAFKKGAGLAFLNQCLEGSSLKDFCCKATVEMLCVQQANDAINIVLAVHHVMFAPVPKWSIISCPADKEEAAIRTAKRFKFRT